MVLHARSFVISVPVSSSARVCSLSSILDSYVITGVHGEESITLPFPCALSFLLHPLSPPCPPTSRRAGNTCFPLTSALSSLHLPSQALSSPLHSRSHSRPISFSLAAPHSPLHSSSHS